MKSNTDKSLTEKQISKVQKDRRSFLLRACGVGSLAVLSGACEEIATARCDSDVADFGQFADPFDTGDAC